jgi:hypothetical protein
MLESLSERPRWIPIREKMKFRKTSIAISLLLATLSLLLAGLWVRSKSTCDIISKLDSNNQGLTIGSSDREIYFAYMQLVMRTGPGLVRTPHGWKHSSSSANVRARKFAWDFSSGSAFISAPHWFWMMGCAIAATMPWIRRRFSLRMVLLLLTITCCVLGLGIWLTKNGF